MKNKIWIPPLHVHVAYVSLISLKQGKSYSIADTANSLMYKRGPDVFPSTEWFFAFQMEARDLRLKRRGTAVAKGWLLLKVDLKFERRMHAAFCIRKKNANFGLESKDKLSYRAWVGSRGRNSLPLSSLIIFDSLDWIWSCENAFSSVAYNICTTVLHGRCKNTNSASSDIRLATPIIFIRYGKKAQTTAQSKCEFPSQRGRIVCLNFLCVRDNPLITMYSLPHVLWNVSETIILNNSPAQKCRCAFFVSHVLVVRSLWFCLSPNTKRK